LIKADSVLNWLDIPVYQLIPFSLSTLAPIVYNMLDASVKYSGQSYLPQLSMNSNIDVSRKKQDDQVVPDGIRYRQLL
jgi:hypothetical protein